MQLKAAYYIEEVAEAIKLKTGLTLGKAIYRRSGFSIPDLEDRSESLNPVYVTVFNQISRGVPTRAGLKLTDFLLTKYVKDQYRTPNLASSNIKFKITSSYWDKLTIEASNYWFREATGNDSYLDQLKYLKLVEIPVKVAQIQKIIVQLLLMEQLNVTGTPIKVSADLSSDVLNIALNELSDTITHICTLANLPEYKVNFEACGPKASDLYITFETKNHNNDGLSRLHIPVKREKIVKNQFLFADAVPYVNLGKEKEWEEGEKFLSKFEFDKPEYREALEYFLSNFFRNTSFLPGQLKIINRALQKKEVIGLLPTGGGKSLTYQLCGLLQPGITVIIDPINSLMKDQHSKLIQYGINSSGFVNAMLTSSKRRRRLKQLTKRELLFVFISPERFQIQEYRESLKSVVEGHGLFHYAVLDEAHCASEWGHDFRPSYLSLTPSIKRFLSRKNPKVTPTILGLTATASFDVLADVQRELQVSEDAICTLPGDAVDRKELNFEIIPIDYEVDPSIPHYIRDKDIGFKKYNVIQEIINGIPQKINRLTISQINNYEEASLFSQKDNQYINGGVIFCPTKSPYLGSGVIALRDGYRAGWNHNLGLKHRIPSLEISTFMGSGSIQTIVHDQVLSEAKKSVNNQEEFLGNKTNLMICTKAFGMGIDKPNIRATIHYSMPSSVEGFYQEAGRAGRNRQPALCALLYNEHDRLQALDFINNSFKNIDREKKILLELMTEIRYEKKFFEKAISRIVSEKVNKTVKVKNWKNIALFVDGPYDTNSETAIKYGSIWLNNLSSNINKISNTTVNDANRIHQVVLDVINQYRNGQDALEWISKESQPGIQQKLADLEEGHIMSLVIGFENESANSLADQLQQLIQIGTKRTSFEWVKLIYTAYDFSQSEEEFYENLKYRYEFHYNSTEESLEILRLKSTENLVTRYYDRIRNLTDTQKAIYRLAALGIVEDYTVDYVGRFFDVKLKAKPQERYMENLTTYLKRYIGEVPATIKAEEAYVEASNENLAPYLDVLVTFVHETIAKKRRNGVKYMSDLCQLGIKHGQQKFRENIKYYFTSKYAQLGYLPKDTDEGKVSNTDIVKKYLEFITDPPDGLGTPIDNLKHLRGACARLLLINTHENYALMILNAIAIMSLEASRSNNYAKLVSSEVFKKHMEEFYNGFCKIESDSLTKVIDLMNTSIGLMNNITTNLKPELDQLREHVNAHYILRKLKTFRQEYNSQV